MPEFEVKIPVVLDAKGKGVEGIGKKFGESLQKSLKGMGFGKVAAAGKGFVGRAGEGGMAGGAMMMGKIGLILAPILLIASALKDFPMVVAIMKLFKLIIMLLLMPLIPIFKPALKALVMMARFLSSDVGQTLLSILYGPIMALAYVLENIKKAWEQLKNIGIWVWNEVLKPAWNFLKNVGLWIWEQILLPAWNFLKDVGLWVWKQIIQPAFSFLKEVGLWIWEQILLPAWNWFSGIGERIWADILLPAWTWFSGIGEKIWTEILKPAWDWFKDIGSKIWDIIKAPFEWLADKVAGIFDFGKGIGSWFKGLFGFQKGGYVPETGPYLLHRGEHVIPAGGAGTVININIDRPSVRSEEDIRSLVREISRRLQTDMRGRISYI